MKRISNGILIFLCTGFSIAAFAQTPSLPPYDPAYQIVFQDEFDSTFRTIMDPSKWERIPGSTGNNNVTDSDECHGHWDRGYVIFNPDSDSSTVRISNGTCKLLTNKIDTPYYSAEVWDWPTCNSLTDSTVTGHLCFDSCRYFNIGDPARRCFSKYNLPFKYTTGGLYSKQKFRYGYFEIKFRIPEASTAVKGFGPNFWMFGVDTTLNSYSEIDVYEIDAFSSTAGHSNNFGGNVHFRAKNDTGRATSFGVPYGNLDESSNQWYKAAVWWSHDFIRFYLNDTLYSEYPWQDTAHYNPPDSLSAMQLFVDINSPAANYCNNFDTASTQFPYTYEIDYVKVYQLNLHCNTDTLYCNSAQTDFKSGLYKSITIGGTSCIDSFYSGINITGLGVEYVLLDTGFSIDATSTAYFDVLNCTTGQSHSKAPQPAPIPQPLPAAFIKRHYNIY